MDLSIIIPMYNSEKYIVDTLNSIYTQEECPLNFEVIIINDGSDDNSLALVKNFISDNKINNCLIIDQNNQGVSASRNAGLKVAQGDYVHFFDSDDLLKKFFFVSLYKYIKLNKFNIILFGFDFINESGELITEFNQTNILENKKNSSGEELLMNILIEKISVWTCSLVYRKDFLLEQNLFYNEKFINGEDINFIHKSIILTDSIYIIGKVLINYIQRPMSISNNFNIRKFDSVIAINEVKESISNPIIKKIYDTKIVQNYLFNIKQAIVIGNYGSLEEIHKCIRNSYPEIEKIISLSKFEFLKKSIKNKFEWVLFKKFSKVFFEIYRLRKTN